MIPGNSIPQNGVAYHSHTIYLLKYCKIRDGFSVLSKLNEGRRSNATLTGTKQRQNG